MPLFPVKDRTIRLTLEDITENKNGSRSATIAAQPRYLTKFIPNSGLLGGIATKVGLSKAESTLDLVGPTSIDINYVADVATESGLYTNFYQPWFIKPVTITISGTSYIGAYSGLSRSDKDVKGILTKFRRSQNDFGDLDGSPGNAARLLLELTGMPRGLSRFLGFMTSFNVKENIDKAYLLGYTMTFIGKDSDNVSVGTGKQKGQQANDQAGIG